jgi:hexulose-6-phosphate isomerase
MNRRTVLASSALASSALAATGSLLAQSPAPKRKLRKAMMMGTVRMKNASLLEKFQAVKAAGYEGVEPNGGMDQQEVLDGLKATGLECASVCCHTHWKETLTHPDAATRKAGIEGVLTTLRNAKAYGAGSILVVPGVVNKDVPYDVAWQRSTESIREAVPLAKELQVRISIENVWNAFLLSPMEMARFVDSFDSPWVGAHFDIGNVLRNGWPEQWIKILGKRINRLHFKEFSVEKMEAEGLRKGFDVDFLQGSNNWPAIMQALDEIGYTGWCISEQRMGLNPADMSKLTEAMDKMFAM